MTDKDILKTVAVSVAFFSGMEMAVVKPESNLRSHLHMDLNDILDVCVDLETDFGVSFNEGLFNACLTVQDIINYVTPIVNK